MNIVGHVIETNFGEGDWVGDIEDMQPFDGYHIPTELWNGWEKPYFEWGVVKEIVSSINELNDNDDLQINSEKKVIIDLTYSNEPYEISGETVQTEDGEKVLYALGTGSWIWSLYSNVDNQ